MTINSTDAIKASNSNVSKYEKEIREEQAKKREKAEKEKVARELVDNLSQYTEAKSVKSVQKDLKAALKEQKELKMISEEEYKQAMSYVKSKDFKESVKEDITSESRTYVAGLAGKSEAVKAKEMQKDVKDVLKEQYKNGEITEEQYKQYKQYSTRTNGFKRFFGKQENEANKLYRGNAADNNVDKVRAEGPKFSDKMQAKINVAGFTTDELYEIYENNGGAADGTVNYSWKKKQPGERDAILAALNKNDGGYEFDMGDVKEIGRTLGYTVEKKVDGGKLLRDVARGALIGAPASYINISQSQQAGGVSQNQSVEAYGVVPAITATTAGISSAITQAHRVEDRAIPTNVPEGVTTYDQYAEHLDNYSTERGAAIGKDIAKYYTYKDGTLAVEQMNKDLSKAAGTVDGVQTPLNYEEALALLGDLQTREPLKEPEQKPVIQQQEEPVNCELVVEGKDYVENIPDATDCYTVKRGDNWDVVVRGKYQPKSEADVKAIIRKLKDAYYEENKEELNKLGITSSRGGFFPKVGEELCIPSTITLENGNTYNYLENGKVKAGRVTRNNNVSYTAASNPFYSVKTGTEYSITDCNGTQIASGLEEGQVQGVIEETKQENPNVNYTIIRK